jgi:hypothetical protein
MKFSELLGEPEQEREPAPEAVTAVPGLDTIVDDLLPSTYRRGGRR